MPLSKGMRETFFGPLIKDLEARLAAESPRYQRELYENHLMGYSMRTDRYRFVLWIDQRDPQAPPIAMELYDHLVDPDENENLADRPEHVVLVQRLSEQLQSGWKAALPR